MSVDSHMYPRGAKTAPSGLSAKADAAAENRIPGSDDAGVRKYQCRVFVGKCVCTDIPDERGGVPVDGSGTTDFDEWYCRHKRIEQLLMALADRSGVDEIRELAAMIEAAKRYGGNIPYLIRRMVRQMQESELVELEIQTVLAAKKLEGRIMLFVPFGIVLFLRMTNASYMQVLYTTATGRLWMGVSLAGIGLCAWWIEKIIRIEV